MDVRKNRWLHRLTFFATKMTLLIKQTLLYYTSLCAFNKKQHEMLVSPYDVLYQTIKK